MSKKFDKVAEKNRRKSLMVAAGLTQAEVARKLGLKPGTVCGVVSGDRKSQRIMIYIARRLGMKMADFWISEKTAA